jgi:hypothetical protein
MKATAALVCLLTCACAAADRSLAPAEPPAMEREHARLLELERELGARLAGETAPDCKEACVLAGRICELAERICGLADQHPGDAEARAECQDGRERCARARAQVAARCPCR